MAERTVKAKRCPSPHTLCSHCPGQRKQGTGQQASRPDSRTAASVALPWLRCADGPGGALSPSGDVEGVVNRPEKVGSQLGVVTGSQGLGAGLGQPSWWYPAGGIRPLSHHTELVS